MRSFKALVVIVGLLLTSAIPAQAAPLTFTGETQAWWDKAGIVIPSQVGQHIHLQATVPADGVIVNGKVAVPVTIKLHNLPTCTAAQLAANPNCGRATSFRVSDGSTIKQSWALSLGPCTDCTYSTTVTVDFSTWGTGRREMRWTANIPTNAEGNRQYNSTGWQVCVRSCSPSYRSGWYTEARGWYALGHDYANARLTSDPSAIGSGATIKVSLKPGSGGSTTRLAGVYIDPDFHHQDAGITVMQRTSAYEGNVTLPTLVSGPHRLVLLSSDGQNAGALAIPFDVP